MTAPRRPSSRNAVLIDAQLLTELLRELVAIDSVNPSLVPGARGEAAAAEFLRDFLRHQGIAAELQEAAPDRSNVIALVGPKAAPGAAGQKARAALAVVAHLDTVGPGDMLEPFTPRARDGQLYGRGALDISRRVPLADRAPHAARRSRRADRSRTPRPARRPPGTRPGISRRGAAA